MTRRESLAVLILAVLMVSAGLTWRFGWYGLVGPGVAVFLMALFTEHANEKETD